MHHGGQDRQGPAHGNQELNRGTRESARVDAPGRRRLAGIRVALTRPARRAGALRALFRREGARVFVHPTIRIAPPEDVRPLLEAARDAHRQDWIVVTSAGGVGALAAAAAAHPDGGGRLPASPRFCAVGPATARALEDRGLRADLVPRRFVAESLLEALEATGRVEGRSFLLPRAEQARDLLPEALRRRSARVREVVAYRTLPDERGAESLAQRVARGGVDVLTFTSGSTVESFHAAWTERGGEAGALPREVLVAAIGPVTAGRARELGLPVHVVPESHTGEGLVEAVAERVAREG